MNVYVIHLCMLIFGCFVPFDACLLNVQLHCFTIGDQLDEPFGSSSQGRN